MFDNKVVKRAMQQFAVAHEIKLARMNLTNNVWGTGARTNAKRITTWARAHGRDITISRSRTQALVDLVLPGLVYDIRRQFHAVKFGEVRLLPSIKYIVLHDMEYSNPKDAAEALGRMVENPNYGASPHFGIDNNSIQQYLAISRTGWHCTNFNFSTIGIEMAGRASNTREVWLKTYAGTIDRTAWLVGKLCKQLSLPVVYRNADHLKKYGIDPLKGEGGITTHLQHSIALKPGDHTDPGKSFPIDILISKAKQYWG